MEHATKSGQRFAKIDLLRFLAAVAVMLMHYGIRGFAYNDTPLHFDTLGPLVRYNYLGVNLFFMISGFVILLTAQGRNVKSFAISRMVRLYPAYWICCTLTFFVILGFADSKIYTSWPRYLLNMTMLNGLVNIGGIDGPYWSLCTEIKFYVLIGILIATGQLSWIRQYLGLWLLLSLAYYLKPNPLIGYLLIPEYSSYFIAGCLFFLIHKEGLDVYKTLLLACSFAAGILYDSDRLATKQAWYHLEFSGLTLAAILSAFYLAFMFILRTRHTPGRLDPLFVFLGSLSYPLYLLHNNIGLTIFINLGDRIDAYGLLAVTMAAMLLLSHFVHVLIERPFAPLLKANLGKVLARA